jgi:uncharacterized RDD family membrane protein YckC
MRRVVQALHPEKPMSGHARGERAQAARTVGSFIMNTSTTQGPYPSAGTPPSRPPSMGPAPAVATGYASFCQRLLALILDGIIVSIPANIFAASLGASIAITGGGFHYRSGGSGLQTLFFIFYEALLIAYWNGQTIGKKAVGIRVVARGGQPVPLGMAFVRCLMKVVSGMVLCLGYLWMLWDPNKQTWHDKVADTYVVRGA